MVLSCVCLPACRGVTAHPSGRWESRIGIPGSKHIYLGLFEEEQEASRAYDRALVRMRGTAASTNFALSDYMNELEDFNRMQVTYYDIHANNCCVLHQLSSPGSDRGR